MLIGRHGFGSTSPQSAIFALRSFRRRGPHFHPFMWWWGGLYIERHRFIQSPWNEFWKRIKFDGDVGSIGNSKTVGVRRSVSVSGPIVVNDGRYDRLAYIQNGGLGSLR